MKVVVLLLALLAISQALNHHEKFISFISEHGKNYHSDHEFLYRFTVFQQNMKEAEEMNAKSDGAIYGATQFSDLTHEEFKNTYLMNNLPPKMEGEYLEIPKNLTAPTKFDWRSSGAVSAIKNQGQCGSCWAFSATENIESVWKISGHPLPNLSPQQIVDCDKTCFGCQGGWPTRAFDYVAKAGGQDSEQSYPYTGRAGTCHMKQPVVAKIKSFKSIPKNEQQIRDSLATTSPFSICVDASKWSQYRGGVMTNTQCGQKTDHAVQLVGYDTTGAQPYWLVRNSWGTGWGESGYIRLLMYKNTCAMADTVSTAVA